jgi:small subunit ribosomal protein S1
LRLSIKQLVPSGMDEYIAEHKAGDLVTGRMMDVSAGYARVELGEGVQGACRMAAEATGQDDSKPESKADVSSLSSMLNARWKGGAAGSKSDAAVAGQVRSFRIVTLDPAAKRIELELA